MNKYRTLLSSKNISVTEARLEILAFLEEHKGPVKIDDIAQSLGARAHQTTLYRSLKVLVEKGLVYQTDFHDGAAYYEYQGEHHHHHLICTSCKKKTPTDFCMSGAFADIEKKNTFIITNHVFELFGLCKNCS